MVDIDGGLVDVVLAGSSAGGCRRGMVVLLIDGMNCNLCLSLTREAVDQWYMHLWVVFYSYRFR